MSWFYSLVSYLPIFFLTLDLENYGVESGNMSQQEVEQHLEMGKKLLAAGQLNDALSHYHRAVEGDPHNYLTFFKRATVYLAIGRSKSALTDLDKVIELRSDFAQARLQRGNVLLKRGELDLAHIDYEAVLRINPTSEEALQQLSFIEPLRQNLVHAEEAMRYGEFQTAIEYLTSIIEVAPWDAEMRLKRAECHEALGDFIQAISDIRPTTKLISDNTAAFLKLSQLHYVMGELEDALREIRECLKLDPEHKQCYPLYKKQKKLSKQTASAKEMMDSGRYEDAVSKLKQTLSTESKEHIYITRAKTHICHCFVKLQQVKDALNTCTEAISLDENNVDALCDRAEAYILNDMFQDAVNDYQKAKNINGDLHKVQEGLEKAQRLLKQSKKRDYYKILGVRRSANKREILKAYRKLAIKWHPDHYEGDDKKKAEKMFIDIAAAKEVLSDPEKRSKFDNGEDPLDPEQQQGGGNPFHGGFPFGGGFGQGFNFKFNFH